MPIYEYECKACGHVLEAIQKFSDASLSTCPQCGKPELNKKISAPGFRLKGGGWYETDFKKTGDKQKNLAGESSSASEAKSAKKVDEKKVEKKPAATGTDKS